MFKGELEGVLEGVLVMGGFAFEDFLLDFKPLASWALKDKTQSVESTMRKNMV